MNLKTCFCQTSICLILVWSGLTNASVNSSMQAAMLADRLDSAITSGDESEIRAILHESVLIFEGGKTEVSLQEYAAHHMQADIAYMAEIEKEIMSRTVIDEFGIAVVTTQYRMTGQHRGKPVDRISLETLVMRDIGEGWKIVHIHWS